jgi:hypothetical protein
MEKLPHFDNLLIVEVAHFVLASLEHPLSGVTFRLIQVAVGNGAALVKVKVLDVLMHFLFLLGGLSPRNMVLLHA